MKVVIKIYETAMISQSVSDRPRWYISHHLKVIQGAFTGKGQRLQAYCQELCTLMMKSMPGLPKLVQHLADYVEIFGIEVESELTQS